MSCPKTVMCIILIALGFLLRHSIHAQSATILDFQLSNKRFGLSQDGTSTITVGGDHLKESWTHEFQFTHDGTCLIARREIYYNNNHYYGAYQWTYDEFDRPIRISFQPPIGSGWSGGSSSTIYEYNAYEDLIAEQSYFSTNGNSSNFPIAYFYKYDESGNLIYYKMTFGNYVSSEMEYIYDDLGKLLFIHVLRSASDGSSLYVQGKFIFLYENDRLIQKQNWERESEIHEFVHHTTWDYAYDSDGNNIELNTYQLDTATESIIPTFKETFAYFDGNLIESMKERWDSETQEYLPFEIKKHKYYPQSTFLETESLQNWDPEIGSYTLIYQREFELPCSHSYSVVTESEYPKLISNPSDFPQILFDDETKPSSIKVCIYSHEGKLVKEYSNSFNYDLYFELKEASQLNSGLYLIHVETESYSKTFKWQREGGG